MTAATSWWRGLWPAPLAIDRRERVRVVVGATLGMLITALACQAIGGPAGAGWPWLVAPMGATAVLVFAVRASPLAQPWAVVGGNTLSALVGIACARWVGPPALAAALAVGAAIGLMIALRCLHPPGGASALLVALSGVTDPSFALFPVLANSLLLVVAGLAYHRVTRPVHLPAPAPAEPAAGADEARALDADLDAVLARYNQILDISREDLKALLEDTQLRAYQRKLANIRCSDIMSRRLITVNGGTSLPAALALFREHRIKALPVVDASGRIAGIVTPADFVRGAQTADTVGQIMTRKVRVASVDRHLVDLIPLFGSSGHHHVPIVDAGGHLVGIITQSDVVAALCQPGAAPASA
ncbi:MAG TPA: HPP family protein [Burkholderiaceae bacterium]